MKTFRDWFASESAAESLLPAKDYEAEAASIKAEVDADPPYIVASLPPYDHDALCPKCRFIAGTTQFWRGWHEHCVIPESPWRPFSMSFGGHSRSTELMWARFAIRSNAIPEHFERACPNCKHQWAEAVV